LTAHLPSAYPALLPTCYENGDIKVGEGGLTEAAGNELCQSPYGFRYVRRDVIRAGNWVGAISAHGQTVEVLPKLEGREHEGKVDLVGLLQAAKILPRNMRRTQLAGRHRDALLDFIAEGFARDILKEATRGLERAYVPQEGSLARPRGRIDFTRQPSLEAIGSVGLACRYDELEHDTALNRLLKAGLLAARRKVRSAAALARIRQALEAFEEVRTIQMSVTAAEAIKLTRGADRFAHLKDIATLFLAKFNPDMRLTRTQAEQHASYAFMWEMPRVYEYAVLNQLRGQLTVGQVIGQGIEKRLGLNVAKNSGVGLMKPDLIIRPASSISARMIVADTKWKCPKFKTADYGCDRDDLNQMMAYAEMHADDQGVRPHLALVYPTIDPKAPCLVGTLKIGQKKDIRLDICRTYVGSDGNVDCAQLAEHFKLLAQAK
jgi:5-methylcytosine-specific restriction endonuclease McrBC regulatory subunit McrC